MKKFIIIFFIFLFVHCSLFIVHCYAWGAEGHKIIAEIAKMNLNKSIQDSVQKYLGDMSWEEASVWMDEVRSDHSYDYMKPWHYVDFEKGENYSDTIAHGKNAIYKLQQTIYILQNRSKLTKGEIFLDLKILFHLLGDMHQPLHVGYGSDKGGNTIKLTFNNKSSNLHRVWDTDIIEYKNINFQEVYKLSLTYPKDEIKTISIINVIDWMNESRNLLPDVYNFTTNTITEEYINKNAPVIEKQILDAGLRLAAVLNEVFKN